MAEKVAEEKKPEAKPESPSGEIVLALQNRINKLEADLQAAETDRKGKSFIDVGILDSKVAELRAEIAELRREKKAVVKDEKAALKEDKSNGDSGNSEEGFSSGLDELDALR